MFVFQGDVPEIRPKGVSGKNKICFFTFITAQPKN